MNASPRVPPRAAGSEEYRAACEEYARIDELRKVSPLAAHLRERLGVAE
jgi:hypothetical protein